MAEKRTPVTNDEMIEVLEEIIRGSGNAAARIAAIKQLRELRELTGAGSGAPPADLLLDDGFAALDELAPRRNRT